MSEYKLCKNNTDDARDGDFFYNEKPRTKKDLFTIQNMKTEINKKFTVKTLYKRLPILNWIKNYSWALFSGDFVAGFTVGLMIIPQALAYGIVAGLSPSYGLYSAFMGPFIYFFLGSAGEMNIGPTAIMSLMTLQYSSQGGADYAVLLGLIAGVLEILAAVFNMGFLINFISTPVISGFTSAAAFTIASSQLKNFFGIHVKTRGLLDTWIKIIYNISLTRYQDLLLGIVCVIGLAILKYIGTIKQKLAANFPENKQKIIQNLIFFISVGRNAIIVIIASLVAYSVDGQYQPFSLTGHVDKGIPKFQVPPMSTTLNNKTMEFVDIIGDVGIGVAVIPFIAILDQMAVVSVFAKGKQIDATQEIFALGVINVAGAFFRGIPTTVCLSRTVVNISSGCKTPVAGLITSIMVLLALQFLTPHFRYIPKASLAAVIIYAVLHMVNYEIVIKLWRNKRSDLLPWAVTFIACMFWGLEWGILLGIGINLSMILYSIAKPKIDVQEVIYKKYNTKFIILKLSSGIRYPNIVHIRNFIRKISNDKSNQAIPIVIDCSSIDNMDFTAAKGLKETIDEFDSKKSGIIFVNLKKKFVLLLNSFDAKITNFSSFSELQKYMKESMIPEVGMNTNY